MKGYETRKLLTGSLILLIAFNLFNVLNFLFNIFTVRYLTLTDYGSLITINYIILIFAVFSETIQTTVTRYISRENNKGKLKNIIKKSARYSLKYVFYFLFAYLLLAYPLSHYLKIDIYLTLLAGLMLFPIFLLPVVRAFLQGKKKFLSLGVSVFTEGSVKLLVAISFVLLGFRIYGAFLGILMGSVISLGISFWMIRNLRKVKEIPAQTLHIRSYTKPVFVANLVLILFLTIDLFFAKLFFSPEIAGVYAVASTLAKIIFLATQPICKAMFPLSSELNNPKKSKKILNESLGILGLIIIPTLLVVFFFSKQIVYLYSGKVLPDAPQTFIILFACSSILSLANMFLFYKLSIGTLKKYSSLFLAIGLSLVLLTLFHNTIIQFSYAVLASSITLLIGVLATNRR